jgi:hypothetical protein
MLRRRHVIASLTTFLSLPLFAVGCGEDDKATPQVVFEGNLQTTSAPLDTAGGEKNCGEAGQLFTIGEFGNPALDPPVPSSPKKSGDADQQGNVSVTCSVLPAGADEFTVSASASLTGATGGTFTIRQAKIKTTGENTGISATFSKRSGAGIVYSQADGGCTIRFTTPFQGVAAGRVWGEIDCPKVTNANAQVACRAVAQFRFENCDQ